MDITVIRTTFQYFQCTEGCLFSQLLSRRHGLSVLEIFKHSSDNRNTKYNLTVLFYS